ncbi:MAG TPA: TolC family protein [Acidobacteriaceae bacterium]|jgi:cobalt-zinc-cadmium efflux system outer membrane protein|nr:TolC family protein [Acidobacteriaceae bacterium]
MRRHCDPRPFLCGILLLAGAAVAGAQAAPAQAPASAPASAPPLTMQQAVDYALAHNPALLAAQQNMFSLKGQEIEAGLRQNPDFTVYGTNLSNPAASQTPYGYSLQVSRLFERGQKRRWRLDSAQAGTAEGTAQFHDQERQTTLAVRQAFTSMIIAKAALKLAQENLAGYSQQLEINRTRYQAGDLGKLDFERLDLQLAQYESDEAAAETDLGQASDQLQTLLGYDRPRPGFDVVGDLVPPPVTGTLESLEQQALASRPDYQAAQSAVRVADANVKLAYANGTTDPTLEGEYDHSGTLSSYGFYVNVPLRIFDRNQGNKEVSKYQAQSSRFSETAARNQVYSDVDQAWVAYVDAKKLSERYNSHYADEAKDVLSIAEFAYQHGGLALIDYLNALEDQRTTALNALNAYAQTWQAIHQLSFAADSNIVP